MKNSAGSSRSLKKEKTYEGGKRQVFRQQLPTSTWVFLGKSETSHAFRLKQKSR